MPTDVLLDHLEKTFADAYRKEIDQEENVWRSLPFFAATLALQLAALAQARDWLIAVSGTTFVVATGLLMCAGLATLAALVFLALSVWPADFRYVGSEASFLAYAEQVRGQASVAGEDEADTAALKTVKAALAQQYALATDNNRGINQRRSLWRTRAGLTTLMSVLAVLVLLGLDVIKVTHGYQGKHPAVSTSCSASVAGVARSKGLQSGGAPSHDGRA